MMILMITRKAKTLVAGHILSLEVENVEHCGNGAVRIFFVDGGNAVLNGDVTLNVIAKKVVK